MPREAGLAGESADEAGHTSTIRRSGRYAGWITSGNLWMLKLPTDQLTGFAAASRVQLTSMINRR